VKSVMPIDLPRPRDVFGVRFTPRFAALHQQLWQSLESDMRAGTDV
jgi:NitT/TauT family transport system ATP-binding protein